MGKLKEVTKIVYRPKYPEAPDKIAYYKEIVEKLNGYYVKAHGSLIGLDSKFNTLVEDSDFEGPYYDEYITHKDNWFSYNTDLYNKLSQCVSDILARKQEAEARLKVWKEREKETIADTETEYVEEED